VIKMSCSKSENGWCDKENDEDWNYCPDCVVVDAIEALEEKNADLMKENADLNAEVKWLRETQQENMKHNNKRIGELAAACLKHDLKTAEMLRGRR
jgi:hypothetical protein